MKKEKNDIRVEMYRAEDYYYPFVQVDYMDQDAQEHTGLMILDSGSSVSLLSNEMASYLGTLNKVKDETMTIIAFSQHTINTDVVRFSFAFGGRQFHESFALSTKALPVQVEGMKVLGLLGVCFLKQHNLAIDYSDYTLHTSDVNPGNLKITDCAFFFPMEIGLKHYEIPVLAVKQNGKEIVTLLDTGASSNMIAEHTLMENGFKCLRTGEKECIYDITGAVEVKKATVRFKMLSLGGNTVFEQVRYDRFDVLPWNIYTPENEDDSDKDQVPPIEVLIGSPFMAEEGWILDFGAKIVYKLKDVDYLKEVA